MLAGGGWTADLAKRADWLKSCGVTHVVMQSTGVYWIAVYDVLERLTLVLDREGEWSDSAYDAPISIDFHPTLVKIETLKRYMPESA
jgi:hypothetical protein